MIELNYKTYGPIRRKAEEDHPILILHGLFGMLDNWKTFGKYLAEENQVFLIDQRDHGRSPHTDSFSYPLLANDLKDFIEFHQLEKVNLIGHSMGGKAIMEAALKYPELINRMVVVDMGVKKYFGGHEEIITALKSVPLEEMNSRKEVDQHLQKAIKNMAVRLFLMKNLQRKPESSYCWKINLDLLDSSYQDLMEYDLRGRIAPETNVLFVKGTESGYIRDKDLADIKEVFPLASFETIENAGHWVHAEQPEKLLSLVSSYFQSEQS